MKANDLFLLHGRTAVVTGGAGLYGYAITEALAEAGANVIVASRSDALFNEKCADLASKYIVSHEKLDITESSSIDATLDKINIRYGKLDILINNAITPPFGRDVLSSNDDDWAGALSGNLLSLMQICRKAADLMLEHKSGCIVNISSIWGQVAPDYTAYQEAKMQANPIAYSVVKGGMNMFTKALASQLGPHGIRVNCISPGGIADDSDTETYRAIYKRKTPLDRWAEPEDIKGAVLYFASDASAYVTGQNLTVDGGYTAL